MTPTPINPPTDRKDINALILNQTDAACLPCGFADEGIMAFLMRLNAYFVSKLYDEAQDSSTGSYSPLAPRCEGSARLKGRLLTSGPYQMSVSKREAQGPHTPMVTSASRSLATRGWLILWPGAARDIYIKTGRSAPALHKAASKFRIGRGDNRNAPHSPLLRKVHFANVLRTLPNIRRIKRLIPP